MQLLERKDIRTHQEHTTSMFQEAGTSGLPSPQKGVEQVLETGARKISETVSENSADTLRAIRQQGCE